jgi:hypothetical protein
MSSLYIRPIVIGDRTARRRARSLEDGAYYYSGIENVRSPMKISENYSWSRIIERTRTEGTNELRIPLNSI